MYITIALVNYSVVQNILGIAASSYFSKEWNSKVSVKSLNFNILNHITLRDIELYTPEELSSIVRRSAGILRIDIEDKGALQIASRSRGTPRIANRLLKRARDFAQVLADGVITGESADLALNRLEVDPLGLDSIDRLLLTSMIRNYNGGPVGLETIAAAIGEESITIEDVCEPYLMQIGFLSRTPRGRMVTPAAYKHLGLPMPAQTGTNNNPIPLAEQQKLDL